MFGYQGLHPLALLGLWLCHLSLATNNTPCQPSVWNNAYNIFLRRHVPSRMPSGVNQNDWQWFIDSLGWDRPTQSFLNHSDLQRVMEVCSDQGGQRLEGNLCISLQPFSFITVRSEPNTGRICSITWETQHLILGCDRLENHCLPVHFEGNPRNRKPGKKGRGCETGELIARQFEGQSGTGQNGTKQSAAGQSAAGQSAGGQSAGGGGSQ